MSTLPADSAPSLRSGSMGGGMRLSVDAVLEKLQRETFDYFLHETNPANGLVIDKTAPAWPASMAATGLALISMSRSTLIVAINALMLKRTKLAGIRQPGNAAAASKLDAPITAQAAKTPAQRPDPQPTQKEAV